MEKKSSKKKVLWGLGILFILLVIIVIIYFVIGYKNDQIESKKKIDSVITSYNNFKTHIDSFNKERDNFYQVVMKDMYYEDLKNNDTYPSKYQYYGFSKDQDNIYKLYGIMGKDETYLNLRTFYNIKDYTLRNNKLVIYSDAINEIRYDSKEDEFYFYELDSFYSKDYTVRVTDKFFVKVGPNNMYYKLYNEEDDREIESKKVDSKILINGNVIYYVVNDGVYAYNVESHEKKLVVPIGIDSTVKLLNNAGDYMYFESGEYLYSYNMKTGIMTDVLKNIIDYDEVTFVDTTISGFLFLTKDKNDDYVLKEYNSVGNKVIDTFEYKLNDEVITYSKKMDKNLYYMKLKNSENIEKYVIIDVLKKEVVKEFSNNYDLVVRVMNNED